MPSLREIQQKIRPRQPYLRPITAIVALAIAFLQPSLVVADGPEITDQRTVPFVTSYKFQTNSTVKDRKLIQVKSLSIGRQGDRTAFQISLLNRTTDQITVYGIIRLYGQNDELIYTTQPGYIATNSHPDSLSTHVFSCRFVDLSGVKRARVVIRYAGPIMDDDLN